MKNLKFLYLASLLFAFSITLQAQDHAREFNYLVDERAGRIVPELSDKGYRMVNLDSSGKDYYQYWWNNRLNKCITIHVYDGRVRSVVNTLDGDCNKSGSNSYSRSDNYSRYQRSGSSYNSASAAYDRGYNDGLRESRFNNSSYRNNNEKDAYADGYEEGRSHRSDDRHWSRNSSNHEDYRDLEGWDAKRAYGELRRRGFDERRHHQQGGTTYRTWYNSRTGQCIKTVSKNERISETMISNHCDE